MTSTVANLGMGSAPQASSGNAFDAAWYLSHYPDVAQAMQSGIVRSPEEHYQIWGQKEGRAPNGSVPMNDKGNAAVPTGPFQVGGASGGGAMPQGGAAPDWVQAARRANQGMNASPFVLNPQNMNADPMSNGRMLYPAAPQFRRDLPAAAAGAGFAPPPGQTAGEYVAANPGLLEQLYQMAGQGGN